MLTFSGFTVELKKMPTLNLIQIIVLLSFLLAFTAIIFEEQFKIEKYKTSMFFGSLTWLFLFIEGYTLGADVFKKTQHAFEEYILEIAILWLFLMCAMTFIAYLDKRGWIESCVKRALPEQISIKLFMFVMSVFVFFFSGVADNLTATLVAITIVLSVIKKTEGKNLIRICVMLIFSANAGGLPLITGDLTTYMVFSEGKLTMEQLLWLYVPAGITCLSLFFIISYGMSGKIQVLKENIKINSLDTRIAIIFMMTIVSILFGHIYFHLPPMLVFMAGLSFMFITVGVNKVFTKHEIHMLDYVRHVEFDALFFFLGVLLLVGALKEVGLLEKFAIIYEVTDPTVASTIVGILSAVVDNIPITAAMLKANLPIDAHGWMVLTYAVGIGGSILVVGSAAGVVAMSKVKELTFVSYLKYSLPIFIVYIEGIGITYFVSFIAVGWKEVSRGQKPPFFYFLTLF